MNGIKEVFAISPVWFIIAKQDILARYRRTSLGPWWITLGTGVGLTGMTVVWSTLFNMTLKEIFPYITIGFILWNFIATILIEGSNTFAGAGILKTVKIPLLNNLNKNDIRLLVEDSESLFMRLLRRYRYIQEPIKNVCSAGWLIDKKYPTYLFYHGIKSFRVLDKIKVSFLLILLRLLRVKKWLK